MARNVRRVGYGVRPSATPRRSASSALLVGAVILALLVAGLWWFNRSATSQPDPAGPPPAASSSTRPGSTTASSGSTSSRPPGAGQATDPASGLRWVDLASLPREASDTMAAIKSGPPYRYPNNDGVVYHNNNGVLPKKADGYYHEFTVVTPGASNRGARRMIAGGAQRGQANQEWYYTPDHYNTFERIRP